MSKAELIYNSKDKLKENRKFLDDVEAFLSDKRRTKFDVRESSESRDYKNGNMISVAAGTATGAAIAGSGVAGAAGLAGATSTLSVMGGAAAAAAGSSVLIPVLVVALPVVAVGGVIGGTIATKIKSEKEKDLIREELNQYKTTVEKQNRVCEELQQKIEKREQKNRTLEEENKQLKARIDTLSRINECLMELIRKLEEDLLKRGALQGGPATV